MASGKSKKKGESKSFLKAYIQQLENEIEELKTGINTYYEDLDNKLLNSMIQANKTYHDFEFNSPTKTNNVYYGDSSTKLYIEAKILRKKREYVENFRDEMEW